MAHEGAGQEHVLPFAFGNHPERACGDRREAGLIQQAIGLGPVVVRVGVPPRFERTMATADHDVACREVGAQLTGHRSAHQRDAWAQRPYIDPAEARAKNLHASGRRPQPGRRQRQQRRLPGPVGTQDHPPLSRSDRPVDVLENDGAFATYPDRVEGDNRPAIVNRHQSTGLMT